MSGNRTIIVKNVIQVPATCGSNSHNTRGIYLEETEVGQGAFYVFGNQISGGDYGIVTSGDRPRVIYNTATGCRVRGIVVERYTSAANVSHNQVSGCVPASVGFLQYGIAVNTGANDGTGNARVRYNTVTGNTLGGILVTDGGVIIAFNGVTDNGQTGIQAQFPGAIIKRNTANGNGNYGILGGQDQVIDNNTTNDNLGAFGLYADAGTVVKNNTANGNFRYGIYGEPGAVDGGGNTATGNGTGTSSPQCFNVQCGSP